MQILKPIIFFLVVLQSIVCNGQLTVKQKLSDFEYLYKTLENNYPYFGRNKRQFKVDWLRNKSKYLNKIKATKTDSAYLATLETILKDLNSGHTNLMPTKYYKGYIRVYKESLPEYDQWVNTLEKDTIRLEYWSKLLNQKKKEPNKKEPIKKSKKQSTENCLLKVIDDNTLLISIKSFSHFNIAKDTTRLYDFLSQYSDFKSLIINIQDNGGGSSSYWKESIVPKLIKKNSIIYYNSVVKGGENNKAFFSKVIENNQRLSIDIKQPNIPEELLDGTYFLSTSTDTIYPKQPIPYKGKIYLLTNEKVYSAAEWFASYCKQSGWATVVGEKTGGGRESDAALLMLPESKIIAGYSAFVGLNLLYAIGLEKWEESINFSEVV